MSPSSLLVALGAFVLMEPFTYLAHRFVMHGAGAGLHRSHHRRWPTRRPGQPFLEANDAFPVVFAAIVMIGFAVGLNVSGLGVLVPAGVGVTLYGAAYALVHDGVIHQRVSVRMANRYLAHVAWAHSLHHRFGGEPYGMLLPVVPADVRERAQTQTSPSVPRRHSSVDSTVRTVNDSPPGSGSATTTSRSPSTASSG